MNYRPIESEDLSEVIEVRASTRENPFSRHALQKIGVTEQSVAEMLQTTHRGWLCEEAGRILGFAMGNGKTGELWVIAVLPDFEGKGIGSRLLALVEDWLWSEGCVDIWLWTSSDPTTRALGFYVHHGWVISERKDNVLYLRKKKTIGV